MERIDCIKSDRTVVGSVLSEIKASMGWVDVSVATLPIPVSLTSKKLALVSRGKLYIAKFVPKYITDYAAYEKNLELVAHLSSEDNRIVNPLCYEPGKYLMYSEGGCFWLSEYIYSKSYSGLEYEAKSAISLLSSFHLMTKPKELTKHLSLSTSLEIAKFFMGLATSMDNSDEMKNLLSKFEELIDSTSSFEGSRSEERILHGDPTIQNFCFLQSKQSAIGLCDFDDLAIGYLERDVATLILSLCGLRYAGRTSTLSGRICPGFKVDFALQLLKQFSATHPILFSRQVFVKEINLVWIEMMCLGIIRGDFGPKEILLNIDNFTTSVFECLG